ncbi:hypothetical protein GCM10027040_10250 [Halomonas shantousis]
MSKHDTRDNRSPDEIESDIEQTRSHLDETLSDLEQRVDPQALMHDAYGYVSHGGASEFFSNLGRTVRQHPVPSLMLGVGVGWLMVASSSKRRSGSSDDGSSHDLSVSRHTTSSSRSGMPPETSVANYPDVTGSSDTARYPGATRSGVADHRSTVTHPGTNDYVRASNEADARAGPGIDVSAGTATHARSHALPQERDYPGIATHLGTRGTANAESRSPGTGAATAARPTTGASTHGGARPLTAESNLPASDLGGARPGYTDHDNHRGRGRMGGAKDRLGAATGKWSEKLRGIRGQAQGMAGDMRDRAHQRQEALKERKQRKQQRKQHQQGGRFSMNNMSQRTQGAQGQIANFVQEHPLVVGALGIALGAALGGMLPSTRAENRTMGAKRDQAMSKASEVGHQQVEKARVEAMEKAADAGQHQVDNVRAKADQAKQNSDTDSSSESQTKERDA